jgi:hypothetical protein
VETASVSAGGLVWLSIFPLLALAGAPLLAHPVYAGIPRLARLVLAGAAGAALVSVTMTVFALFGIPWSVPAVLTAAIALGFGMRGIVRAEKPMASAAPGVSPSKLPALVAGVSVAAAFLATTAGSASSPDLLFFWGAKAQRFALARTVDAAYLGESSLAYMHAYYPPLVTNLYALASIAAGRMSWTAATFLFPLLLAALAAALPGILRAGAPERKTPAAAAAASLTIAAIAVIGMEADVGGNGEMPLLLFETASIALLLSPLGGNPAGQLLVGWMLAGAVTTKIEGLPFALTAIAAFVWIRRGSIRIGPALLRLGLPAAASLLLWFAFGEKTHLFRGYSGEGALLAPHPEHLAAALRAIASALASTAHSLPCLIPFACLLTSVRRLDRDAAIPLATAAALSAFLLFTYLDRPGDPSQWIAWSAPRVFSPLPMLFALAAAGAEPRRPGDSSR